MENKRFRVWLYGHSMTASYSGYVDVVAQDEEEAEWRAKRTLTKPGGTFYDWSPSMFETNKIERL